MVTIAMLCWKLLSTIFVKASVVEYYPSYDAVSPTKLDTGYVVCFCFVCNAASFGIDKNIFFE